DTTTWPHNQPLVLHFPPQRQAAGQVPIHPPRVTAYDTLPPLLVTETHERILPWTLTRQLAKLSFVGCFLIPAISSPWRL
ncbi:MAG: hypothetical protein KDE29_04870, partial [Anaerolineales bacterium]|nr:hypothetical protein [Anaerolineales bacterium]